MKSAEKVMQFDYGE